MELSGSGAPVAAGLFNVSRLQAPVHVLLEPDRRGVAAGASAASFSSLREQLSASRLFSSVSSAR